VTRYRNLDYSPLASRSGLGPRLRAAGTNNLLVLGGTVGILLVIVPLVVLIGLLATGNATDVVGLVVLAMCFGGGVYTLIDVLRKGGRANAFGAFARANDLTLVRGSTAAHYAGSLFADESHAVRESARTREDAFVEVGERFPTTAPRSSRQPNRPELFLRARLAGRATHDPPEREQLVTPELHDALSRFAGPYAIEVSEDEITLFGSHELDVVRPGRVQEAFALADELVTRANATLVRSPPPSAYAVEVRPTQSGSSIRARTRAELPQSRLRGPLTIIGWLLALMIGGPIVIAIIVSVLDGRLPRMDSAAPLVVSLIVIATLAVVARVVKSALTPRRDAKDGPPESSSPSAEPTDDLRKS